MRKGPPSREASFGLKSEGRRETWRPEGHRESTDFFLSRTRASEAFQREVSVSGCCEKIRWGVWQEQKAKGAVGSPVQLPGNSGDVLGRLAGLDLQHTVIPATRMAKVEKTIDSEWWQGSRGLKRMPRAGSRGWYT